MSSSPAFRGAAQITRRGGLLNAYASGMADDESGELGSLTTRFQVGSVSKQFVAAAVLLAREGDLLRLDEPISRWFDDLRPDLGSITVHQLLSHTSGLGHWDDVPEFNVLEPPPPDEMFIGISAMRPASSPGSHWSYSGPGYLLAAWSVERLTGVPYSTFVSNRILGPLGMEATTSGTFPTDAGAARGYYAGARARGGHRSRTVPGHWRHVVDSRRPHSLQRAPRIRCAAEPGVARGPFDRTHHHGDAIRDVRVGSPRTRTGMDMDTSSGGWGAGRSDSTPETIPATGH